MAVTFDDIAAAAARIADGVARTPTVPAHALATRLGLAALALKLETLQRTGSFKERGALNRLLALSEDERRAGVITMSAGNHAQAVAYHAQRLGIPATVVMPASTPNAKVMRTRGHGARVVLHGETLADSARHARALAAEHGLTLVHPYDDDAIIAGQGTAALELLRDAPDLDTIVVPVGGGGLIAGCAVAARALRPGARVIGVEVEGWAACAQRLAGEEVRTGGATIAEGIAVRDIGERPFAIIRDHVERVLVVPEQSIEEAIGLLAEEAKIVTEGAGAAGIAALIAHAPLFAGARVGVMLCGANIDARILANVLLRNLVRDGRLLRLAVDIADRPGVLADVAGRIAAAGGNIIEVTHQRLFATPSVRAAELDLVVEARDALHGAEILAALEGAAFRVKRI
ncbi:threonine ammonia-lyase [Elioraea sp. Yellowstone]|uniref:threonine ammonia-lyase n=1 Tax=Elioraea sp. Yellowstone TaxID=2592070 RepID=UPI0011537FA5|nr:threonine ammonia-lyase [Elioraea sp. Yellowstone]TQF82844.1 threonine ammonia-lyase [Elioraea sp. Yellowstone]